MEDQVQNLVQKTWNKFEALDASKRYLIALAGIPGSGKTTTAASIAHNLNIHHHTNFHTKWPNSSIHRTASQPDVALVVPLDGYHLTRTQLSSMPNADEAHFRRGAAFTFDPTSYLNLVHKLRQPIEAQTRTIHAPSFDHSIKDPVANDIHIPPTARIIILEGLYTALDRDIWRDAASQMDETWFLEIDIETATERVAKRNFKAGLSPSYEEAVARTKANDMVNAREIMAERVHVDEVIRSVEDDEWRSEELREMEEDEEYGDAQRPDMRMRMDSIAELAAAGGGC